MHGNTPLDNQQGITYLIVMFTIVLMGISLMAVGQQWSVIMKRDREAELLFRGTRIKHAIELYAADHEVQKATRPNKYPQKLEDLTKKTPKRYLQVIYKDPITGKDFDLIKSGQEIRGVRSTSMEQPFDQVRFKGARSYHAIKFEATNASPTTPNNLDPTQQAPSTSSPPGESPSDPTAPPSSP